MLVVFRATSVIMIGREAPEHVHIKSLQVVGISFAGIMQTERES